MTTTTVVCSPRIASLAVALVAIAVLVAPARTAVIGTGFTYQGALSDAGSAPNGPYDFRFKLFDAASAGSQVGPDVIADDLQVTVGIFSTEVDFGNGQLYGDARWIQVEVRPGASTGSYTTLPRQRLTPTPLAIGLSLPHFQTHASGSPLIQAMNTGAGSGAMFLAGGSSLNYGVVGFNGSIASQAAGVRGISIAAAGDVIGVEGVSTNSPTGTGIVGKAKATGGYLQATDPGSTGLFAYGEATGAHIQGTGSSSVGLSVYGGGSGARVEGTGTLSTGFYAFGNFRGIYAESRGIGAAVEARRVSGTGHLILAANTGGNQFWVDNSGVTHTKVLEIMGGADLSERFDIERGADAIEPGTVVSIDARREGRLAVSREPYDHRVAGIISGAGGVKTGMLMGQEGSVADGAHPVALTGRVYCRATAANGPIRPGDLLTTSSVPGHAMRVDDPARAQGATLGKAMGSLEKGEGLVLVLVGLQ